MKHVQPQVGRVSTRHGRLKSALQKAIADDCRRSFTLNAWLNFTGIAPIF